LKYALARASPRGKTLVDLDQHPRPAALDRLHAFSP
jgi:hypothetical protein